MGKKPVYKNSKYSHEERAENLVSLMTIEEKVSQLFHESPAIARLGVPAFNWWNECLHGVARAGRATVFPQAIGLAASFDEELMSAVGGVISDEARAKNNKYPPGEKSKIYHGLTFWSPNINIYRDPRWGRGQETYGEDPYLTSRMAAEFIKALQGNDPQYLKIAACAKHFAAHSGPEFGRLAFDAKVNEKDLWETYLPAFEAAVKEAKVESVMGAYNRLNNEPCCAGKRLFKEILRGMWGFKGYTVSDCGAITAIHENHKAAKTAEESAAAAINGGIDLNCCLNKCEGAIMGLKKAFAINLIEEKTVDNALKNLFATRFRLGLFDPKTKVRYAQIPYSVVDSPGHKDLAIQAAVKSAVLMKNSGVLPLNRETVKSMAVIGPNADSIESLLGNYNGTPSKPVSMLAGIKKKAGKKIKVNYAQGCGIDDSSKEGFQKAVRAAKRSDIIIAFMGLSPAIEGEECDVKGERKNLMLPGVQEELLAELKKTGKPLVLVLLSGGSLAPKTECDAVLQMWYPGQSGGAAAAEILFGDSCPGGRLPVTFYKKIEDLPAYDNYSMEGRTYRFFKGEPLYPFGFGLSYTRFSYSNIFADRQKLGKDDGVNVSVEVTNEGDSEGDEVVQVYLRSAEPEPKAPLCRLAGFKRITLKPKAKKKVDFRIGPAQLKDINIKGEAVFRPGDIEIFTGGVQPGFEEMTGNRTMVLKTVVKLEE